MIGKMDGREFLPYVLEHLNRRIAEIDLTLAQGQKEIEDMHEYYWENYTEMDQYGYENFDNQQALLHQINANQEQLDLRRRFRKMLDSPFFGRVDFLYEGEEEPEIFYIGIGNFARNAGGIPLVYDWRAPVSGLFYDFDKGPASYAAPLGELRGEITSKWQYKIRGGKMIYDFESDIKIDDEILAAELGGNGETYLKNIIRTIQREQNAVIRNTRDRILVIQGAAGSGKTSIALHRIAYLLYHDRKNLRSSNILVLSPNSVFSDYISHILPELGEENIQEMSFDLFAYRELKDVAADCEDRYDQIERNLNHPQTEDFGREKQSREFLNRLERFVMELEDELMRFSDVKYRTYTMEEKRMIELFYFRFQDIPLLARMDAVAEYFIDEVATLCGSDLPEEDEVLLSRKFQKMYETTDVYVLYSGFLKREGYGELPDVPPEKRHLRYEDVYPVLYLKYRLKGGREHFGIKHLVVDEMQDYSRLQFLILQKMFPCRMTILGDRAQTMDREQQDAMAFLPQIFGKETRCIVMNKSYRNTAEIAEYASKIAGIGDMEIFQRHGAPVEEHSFAGFAGAMEEIALRLDDTAERFETAAVILRTERDALRARDFLEKRWGKRVSYLDRNSSAFEKGITVTTFYLAKGLEFECVFSVFPREETESALSGQGRYIAATRAMHELKVFEYGV